MTLRYCSANPSLALLHRISVRLLLATVFAAMSIPAFAQDLLLDYAAVLEGIAEGEARARDLAVDASGNTVAVGEFIESADFDPGVGGTLVAASDYTTNAFVTRLDSSGDLDWVFAWEGIVARGVAVDGDGDIYVTGMFSGTVDFDPGAGTTNLDAPLGDSIFVTKLNSSGALIWAVALVGGSGGYTSVNDIDVDASENVYLGGLFYGTMDFDPGAGTDSKTSTQEAIFVTKLNSSGALSWAHSIDGTSDEAALGIGVDSSNSVCVAGRFQGTVDFDPGAGTTNRTATGTSDAFIAKFDTSGALLWSYATGGTSDDSAEDVATDSANNVYVTGRFFGTSVDFDPGVGTTTMTSSIGPAYLQKFNASGTFQWAAQTSAGYEGIAYGISVDGSDNVYITGAFTDAFDILPGVGAEFHTPDGGSDAFVEKFNSSGVGQWITILSDTAGATGTRCDSPAAGVYTAGTFYGTADFDPGAGTATVLGGTPSGFLQALDANGALVYHAEQKSSNGRDYAIDSALDGNGNLYIVGAISGAVDFDTSADTNIVTGNYVDTFIAKFDPAGGVVWFTTYDGPASFQALAVDGSGNVYLTGGSYAAYAFYPDILVVKLDNTGALQWQQTYGNVANFTELGKDITVGSNGNVYVTGNFGGSVNFGGPTISGTNGDAFVLNLDASGATVWARDLGGNGGDYGTGIAVDDSSNVFVTGTFASTVDFDPGPGTASRTVAGAFDIFVEKLDPSGNFVWVSTSGGPATDASTAITLGGNGDVATAGYFEGTADFDPGPGTLNLSTTGNTDEDAYVQVLDSTGALAWATRTGAAVGDDRGIDLNVDGSGNYSIMGHFLLPADFDPGPGTVNLSPVSEPGHPDVFVQKLDAQGNYLWAGNLGRGKPRDLTGGFGRLSVDPSGNIYVADTLYQPADFDPGVAVQTLNAHAFGDIYIWKLGITDTDGDGVADWDESNVHSTNPNDSDSDNDGLEDGAELFTHHTDPMSTDSDGDTVDDGEEVQLGMNPTTDDYAIGTTGSLPDVSTQQFTVVIPAGSPVQQLSDLNVRVNITHPFDANLKISLTSPSGTTVVLAQSLGGSGDNYTNTWFDDEGTGAIGGQSPPFTGHFVPGQALTAFDTEDPQGMWTLTVQDQTAGDTGSLTDWGLSMTTVNRTSPFSPVWVNFAAGGDGNGSISLPYNTLAQALTQVESGGRIKMFAGSTSITPTINQNVRLDASGGSVTIGAP